MDSNEQNNANTTGSASLNFKDGLSIDEAKVSALIVCTIADFIFIVFCIISDGDISDNHLFLFQTLIAAVAGVNIADKVSSIIKTKIGR